MARMLSTAARATHDIGMGWHVSSELHPDFVFSVIFFPGYKDVERTRRLLGNTDVLQPAGHAL